MGVGRRGKPQNSMSSPVNVFPTKFKTLCGRATYTNKITHNVTDGTVLVSLFLRVCVCVCLRACVCVCFNSVVHIYYNYVCKLMKYVYTKA